MSDDIVEPPPVLRVVRGRPTPEELAAVSAVLLAGGSAGVDESAAAPSRWRGTSALRAPLPKPGPGAWRAAR